MGGGDSLRKQYYGKVWRNRQRKHKNPKGQLCRRLKGTRLQEQHFKTPPDSAKLVTLETRDQRGRLRRLWHGGHRSQPQEYFGNAATSWL